MIRNLNIIDEYTENCAALWHKSYKKKWSGYLQKDSRPVHLHSQIGLSCYWLYSTLWTLHRKAQKTQNEGKSYCKRLKLTRPSGLNWFTSDEGWQLSLYHALCRILDKIPFLTAREMQDSIRSCPWTPASTSWSIGVPLMTTGHEFTAQIMQEFSLVWLQLVLVNGRSWHPEGSVERMAHLKDERHQLP